MDPQCNVAASDMFESHHTGLLTESEVQTRYLFGKFPCRKRVAFAEMDAEGPSMSDDESSEGQVCDPLSAMPQVIPMPESLTRSHRLQDHLFNEGLERHFKTYTGQQAELEQRMKIAIREAASRRRAANVLRTAGATGANPCF